MKSFINGTVIQMQRLAMMLGLLLAVQSVQAQQNPAPPQQTPPADSSKLRFADKISHWQIAYGMSGPEFMEQLRNKFKASAFAEVYIEGTIDHGAWMFTLLNKVTKFRYQDKTTPYVLFEVKFKPTTPYLDGYQVLLTLTASQQISANLNTIASEAAAKYLGNKTYADPSVAVPDIEKTLTEAMTVLDEKLGDELAPNLMVRYDSEVFWNGHEIPITDADGNFVELEAIGKDGKALRPGDITWTNADPYQSKGVVDMTGINSKAVTLTKAGDNKPLVVTIKRANTDQDLKELLKMLIVEVLTTKKQQATDTIPVLKRDSVTNAAQVSSQIAKLEQGNYPLEDIGVRPVGLFSTPPVLSQQDEVIFNRSNERKDGFTFLRKRKWLSTTIRKKVNVVAFANLVVDQPEKMNVLLEALLANSGRLIARLILNTNSQGQRDAIRNIVVDFMNRNLEQIAGGSFGFEENEILPAIAPTAAVTIATDKKLGLNNRLYINPSIEFQGKQEFVAEMSEYLNSLETPAYLVINYSQDINTESYIARAQGTRPEDISEEHSYVAVTLVNIPGSVKYQLVASSNKQLNSIEPTNQSLASLIKQIFEKPLYSNEYVVKNTIENFRCAYVSGQIANLKLENIKTIATEISLMDNVTYDLIWIDRHSDSEEIKIDPKQSPEITNLSGFVIYKYKAADGGYLTIRVREAQSQTFLAYLNPPSQAIWNYQLNKEIESIESFLDAGTENVNFFEDHLYSIGACGLGRFSGETAFKLIQILISEYFRTDGEEEELIINVIKSIENEQDAIDFIDQIKLDESGFLSDLMGVIDGDNKKHLHAALAKVFFVSKRKTLEADIKSFEDKIKAKARLNLADWSENNVFFWVNAGVIKRFTETNTHYLRYSGVDVADNGAISFNIESIVLVFSETNFDAEKDPFELIRLELITSSKELYGGAGKGHHYVPAINLALLINEQSWDEFNQAINIAFTFGTLGSGVLAQGTKIAIIEGFFVSLNVASLVIDDYRYELTQSENGKTFLQSWEVFNAALAIWQISKVVVALPRAYTSLKEAYARLKNSHPDQASKISDKVDEVLKQGEEAFDDLKNLKPAEEIVELNTINKHLKGGVHPKTKVPFEEKIVEYAGKKFKGVFPKFEYKFRMKLPKNLYQSSDPTQFRAATRFLRQEIKRDAELAKKFNAQQLEDIAKGKSKITDLTWHHHEEEGIFELVDDVIHGDTGHTGGRNIWGGGTSSR